jgi:hypothetical protein
MEKVESRMKTTMVIPSKADIRKGRELGKFLHQHQAARAVRYLSASDRIELDMVSGLTISLPRECSPHLAKLTKRAMQAIGLTRFGDAMEIKSKDLQVSIGGLLQRVLGLDHSERGGRARTPAKTRAARLNGRKGGRPKKRAA